MSEHVRVAIVGTGFAGLGMAVRLREQGVEDVVVLERADDVGGTWRDNSYPGCACDVPSHLYSLSFAHNPDWSRTFSRQPEIQAYLQRVARERDVLRHVRFGHDVREAAWDEQARRWRLTTSRGDLTADVLVAALGGLSQPSVPSLPGLDRFAGTTFHSAAWNHDHDLTGERVAVVGTGASAIQFVPEIQPRVGHMTVFQRTPPWIVPRLDRPVTALERAVYRRVPGAQSAMRAGIYWARESFLLAFRRARVNRQVERAARSHLRRQVPDPALRARLTPRYRIGCKRVLLSNDYLPALTRENVSVVTDGIREVRERAIVTADGTEHPVDTIIFGTGFRVTPFPAAERIRGRGGRRLVDEWTPSMQAHKGTTVAGFPNLAVIPGPNTGLGHNSQVFMIECQIAYVADALRVLSERGMDAFEVRPEAQAAWNEQVQADLRGTVWTSGGCASWYLDASGRNTVLWPRSTWRFHEETRRFDVEAYELSRRVAVDEPEPLAA